MTLTLGTVRDDGKAYLIDRAGTVWSTRPPYGVDTRAMLVDAQMTPSEPLTTFDSWDDAEEHLSRRFNIESPRTRAERDWKAEYKGRRGIVTLLDASATEVYDEDGWFTERIRLWLGLHGDWLASVWPEFQAFGEGLIYPDEYSEDAVQQVRDALYATIGWLRDHKMPAHVKQACTT